jgi:LmbE family N-acetylglucosaminyl deacetylase
MEKFLFIGAHPDDIEFGAGGTLTKSIGSNIDCQAIVFSDCHESLGPMFNKNTLISESENALIALGLNREQVTFLDFPVRKFSEYRQEILQILIDLSRNHSFSKVFLPCSLDMHQDHSVIHTEAVRAFKFGTVLGYELPWNNLKSDLRYFSILSDVEVEKKTFALGKFKSQESRHYANQDAICTALKFRGLQINKTYAEAFEVVRWVES